MLNYDDVFNLLLETFKNNEEVVKNTLFFQAFEKISEYINNKRGLIQIFLKSKNIRVFDIINDKGIFLLNKIWIYIFIRRNTNHLYKSLEF